MINTNEIERKKQILNFPWVSEPVYRMTLVHAEKKLIILLQIKHGADK